mmetsp:Transcript_33072/g.33676  ORF Transcript_33072/g.33676 Transcript_33072/m.33676 type:complete len:188 (-) Transcript_33072:99-662(-)|eukprot:CAMPEP_0182419126 /NCGR_PEP_ID=MMETSP1167-20130531/3528_1 /TAXON_ID=2988 /ORGANISM="Mallomonas Sp, Strain CCMP3275" /LENGTH=187 /DNA_ID=CAMNT_0024593771 /DNA_START=60 /DNA_END=623 /DNA_ORIENTATION=+
MSSYETSLEDSNIPDDMTVEQFLTKRCDEMIKSLDYHGEQLISKLTQEFAEGSTALKDLLAESSGTSTRLCVILKVIAGAHLGQKFRLEPSTNNGEDLFKIGRSTGRHFREKGVSLYKDKEISTTHAKIETRNGEVFLTDCRSTNGTLLNRDKIETYIPVRLSEGDVIEVGSSELQVCIMNADEADN